MRRRRLLAGMGQASAQGYFIPNRSSARRRPRSSTAGARTCAERAAPRAAAPVQQTLPPPPPVEIQGGMPAVPDANLGDNTGEQACRATAERARAGPARRCRRGCHTARAVIGVLGVPEIMRAATASQQVEKVIGERRAKLNEDAQKEQTAVARSAAAACRPARHAVAGPGPHQGAGAAGADHQCAEELPRPQPHHPGDGAILAEPDRADLDRRHPQVAESRGMNLVLHRAQVALNINEFDITDQVTQQMNKVMPSVTIPPMVCRHVAQAQAEPRAATPASAAPNCNARR